jgi:transposase InsO family protein
VLAAHRRTADAAGIEWKSAVYRKVGEEVSAGRRLTIERMVELGGVSRSGYYEVMPALVDHSDHGSQCASNDYTELLKANGIQISMSRKGNHGTARSASRS